MYKGKAMKYAEFKALYKPEWREEQLKAGVSAAILDNEADDRNTLEVDAWARYQEFELATGDAKAPAAY
eukprot:gene11166-8475_t